MTIFEVLRLHVRDRITLTSLVLAVALTAHAQNPHTDAVSVIRGTWTIQAIYHTQNVEGPSPTEQNKLVGSEVVYGDQTLTACGQSVPISSVDQHRVDSAEFLASNRVRFAEVDIHARSVMEVVLNNRQAGTCFETFPLPGQDVYLKSKDEIVIAFEGVFYRAVRKK
jgi:hypothetical protein